MQLCGALKWLYFLQQTGSSWCVQGKFLSGWTASTLKKKLINLQANQRTSMKANRNCRFRWRCEFKVGHLKKIQMEAKLKRFWSIQKIPIPHLTEIPLLTQIFFHFYQLIVPLNLLLCCTRLWLWQATPCRDNHSPHQCGATEGRCMIAHLGERAKL